MGTSSQRNKTPRDRLLAASAKGGITLVLGAGVSIPRGIPSWDRLVTSVWRAVFRETPSWKAQPSEDVAALEAIRTSLAGSVDAKTIDRIELWRPDAPGLAMQIALELVEAELERRHHAEGAYAELGPHGEFARLLKDALYAEVHKPDEPDTLQLLADILRQEHLRERRRIKRVITFNVDDLLEREVHDGGNDRSAPVLWPIPRASSHIRRSRGANDSAPIPTYHVHGFLPSAPDAPWHTEAPDTLVFTDAQYWASVSEPMSFANRVLANALHDSHCVFLGLSMSDINLLRWLGFRYNEIVEDKQRQFERSPNATVHSIATAQRRALERHFWIRPDHNDPYGLMSRLLHTRGVLPVPIERWGSPLTELLKACFDPGSSA